MTRSDRYAEAFWWIVPIPAALAVAAVVTVGHPSPAGAIALGLVSLVGLTYEGLVWRSFRRRWAGELVGHPMDVAERLRHPLEVIIACGAFVAAASWKARGLGESWGVSVLMGVGYLGFLVVLGAIIEGVRYLRPPIGRKSDQ